MSSTYNLIPTAVALLCSGCVITIGPLDETTGNGDGKTSVLPDPEEEPVDEPALDEAQQARKEEADRYTADVIYQGAEVLATFQLPSGDILDFINRDTLPALPYEVPPLPLAPEDLALLPGAELGITELEQLPDLVEVALATTPFHRPTFWPYILGETDAASIEDYLARYQVGGDPSGINRLYAGLASAQPNRGMSGYVNQFRPEVAAGSFSLLEFAVSCPADGPLQEQIGVVISVDKANPFGTNQKALLDGEPRLHIEYLRTVSGQLQNSWDGMDGRFVSNPFRLHHPGQKVPASVPSGTQVEHLLTIFQSPTGDWWIAYNLDLLGYYPASLFTVLNGGACRTTWYGEVYNPDPGVALETEMGSGKFAGVGLYNAAHVRNPMYYDPSWFGWEPGETVPTIPYNPLCYDRSLFEDGLFLFGGPGSKNASCQWP